MNTPAYSPAVARRRKEQQEELQRLQELFDTQLGRQVLSDLERRFETDLPVFQGKAGSYDPLDAMRRDAHREVFLVIHHLLRKATLTHSQPTNQEHDDET
jgi:hypothetical protein